MCTLLFWRQHTAGQSRDGFQISSELSGCRIGTSLIIGLLYVPLGVRTVTTRTFPSCPGCALITHARGHLVGIVGSSRRHTMVSTCMFGVGFCHFDNLFKVLRYSFDHRFQKWVVSFWHKFHLRNMVTGSRDSVGSGNAIRGFPIRKCPGVNTSNPSESSGRGISGLEFRHASIWVRVVVSSSYVNLASPTTLLRCCLKLFTDASHRPPK